MAMNRTNNKPVTTQQIQRAINRVAQRCYFNKPEHLLPANPITYSHVKGWQQAYMLLLAITPNS